MGPGQAEADGMRNLPRFALVPLAALISALPLVALPTAAGASLRLVHAGEAFFFTGLGLLVLGGRRRRRLTS